MLRVKKNDRVQVVTGNERGKVGRVLRLLPGSSRVVVEGVNKRFKHVRRSQQNPQGGRLERENPIDVSNVMPYCESCQRGVRIRFAVGEDGTKHRVCAKHGGAL